MSFKMTDVICRDIASLCKLESLRHRLDIVCARGRLHLGVSHTHTPWSTQCDIIDKQLYFCRWISTTDSEATTMSLNVTFGYRTTWLTATNLFLRQVYICISVQHIVYPPEMTKGYCGLVWSYWRRKFLVFPCPKLGKLRTSPGTILHGQV